MTFSLFKSCPTFVFRLQPLKCTQNIQKCCQPPSKLGHFYHGGKSLVVTVHMNRMGILQLSIRVNVNFPLTQFTYWLLACQLRFPCWYCGFGRPAAAERWYLPSLSLGKIISRFEELWKLHSRVSLIQSSFKSEVTRPRTWSRKNNKYKRRNRYKEE